MVGLLVSMFVMVAPATAQGTTTGDVGIQSIEAKREEARAAYAAGKPAEALSLIEDVIRAWPADLRARFFRAQILVATGRGESVREELELILKLNLPGADLDRTRKLLAAIDGRGSRLSLSGRAKVGYGHVDNANAWPNGGQYTYRNGVTVDLPDPVYSKRKAINDTFTDINLSLNGSYALDKSASTKAIFGFAGRFKSGDDTVNLDRDMLLGNIGLRKNFMFGLSLEAMLTQSKIDRVNKKNKADVNTDLDNTSYSLSASQKLSSGRKLLDGMTVGLSYASLESDASEVESADLSDATTATTSIYAGNSIGKTWYLRGSYAMADASTDFTKPADLARAKNRSDKETSRYSLLVLKLLPNAQRVIVRASMSETDYDTALVGTGKKRSDDVTFYTLKYTIEGSRLLSVLDGYTLGIDGTYLDSSSNQKSATLTSNTVLFSISRNFVLY